MPRYYNRGSLSYNLSPNQNSQQDKFCWHTTAPQPGFCLYDLETLLLSQALTLTSLSSLTFPFSQYICAGQGTSLSFHVFVGIGVSSPIPSAAFMLPRLFMDPYDSHKIYFLLTSGFCWLLLAFRSMDLLYNTDLN